jgi:dienelactone hydrolase
MAIIRHSIPYEIDGTAFESLAVWDGAVPAPRPAVLIAPTFMGRTANEDDKAARLAALGYVGFAMDLYGVATKPAGPDEASAAMATLDGDRARLAARMVATLAQMRRIEGVDAVRTAAIGFCFGGKCVLDLARTGADVAGVATFHGIFDAPTGAATGPIAARILAMHGWDDPLAPPEALLAFAAEMTARAASWELVAYGHTEHGFTANHRPQMYRPEADARSSARLVDFLGEVLRPV